VATGTVSVLPLTGGLATGGFQVVGRTDPSEKFGFSIRDISSGYLHAIGVPLIAGRNFDNRDAADGPRVVMINLKLALAAFPHEDPVGKRVVFPWIKGHVEIVGVAGDENTGSLDAEVQRSCTSRIVRVWAAGGALWCARPAGDMVDCGRSQGSAGIDAEVVVSRVRTMEQVVADAPYTVMRRYPAMLMGAFAAIALLMAVIGI